MNIQQLKARYAAPEIPKCRVCGGELTIQRAGGGPTIWGCTGMIDDPIGERKWIYAEGRSCADEHYERSRWSDYRQGGDADVIELIDALEAAERERDELINERTVILNEMARIIVRAHDARRLAEAELARRDAALGAQPAASVPDGLATAVNRLLDSDGSRGTFSAIRRGNALEEVERLLAAAPAPGGVDA